MLRSPQEKQVAKSGPSSQPLQGPIDEDFAEVDLLPSESAQQARQVAALDGSGVQELESHDRLLNSGILIGNTKYDMAQKAVNAAMRKGLIDFGEVDDLFSIFERFVETGKEFETIEDMVRAAKDETTDSSESDEDDDPSSITFPLGLWSKDDENLQQRNLKKEYRRGSSLRRGQGMDYETVDKEAFAVDGNEDLALVIRMRRVKGAGSLMQEIETLETLRRKPPKERKKEKKEPRREASRKKKPRKKQESRKKKEPREELLREEMSGEEASEKKDDFAAEIRDYGYYPINGVAHPALLMKRYASSSKTLVRRVKKKIQRTPGWDSNIQFFDTADKVDRGIESLRAISSLLIGKKLGVDDIQFLIDGDGTFVINDAAEMDKGYLEANMEVIDELQQVLTEHREKLGGDEVS